MSNILISTPPTSLATGLLQLDGGVAISSTPVYVADQNNTDSKLALSTTSVNVNTTSGTALVNIKGTGNTSSSSSLIVQNSAGTELIKSLDDGTFFIGNSAGGNFRFAQVGNDSYLQKSNYTTGKLIFTGTSVGTMSSVIFDTSKFAINTGTTTATSTLQIKGSGSTSATTTALFQNSSSTTSLLIRDDGNVGIGDSSPYKTLSVKTTISTEGIQVRGANNSAPTPYTGIRFSVADQSVVTDTYNKGAIYYINNTLSNAIGSFVFALNNTGSGANVSLTDEKMRLLNNGNLLIGTTTDAGFKLQVNGDGYLSQVRVGTGAGSISSNTIVGYQALNTNSSGGFNTGVGFQSLQGITTSSYNASFGYRSLYISTTGSNNTSIGALNSALNSTGSNNVSVGYGAHYSNSTGSNNTLVGYNCQATNFDSCVVLGRDASATASNQFVVGSASYNAGTVVVGANASTQYWNVKINGVDYKILLA